MKRSIILFLLLPLFQFAQIDDVPYIEVIGTAELEIIPDEIYISITLKEGKDSRSISEQEDDLTNGLSKLGVDLNNLSLGDANANYVKVKWNKKDVIGSSNYLLKVGDANMVGEVFEMLDEIKIEGAYISKVNHSNIEELRKQVRIDAIKAAKEKADYLLEAVGSKSGKPIAVYEANRMPYGPEEANVRGSYVNNQSSYIDGKMANSDQIVHFRKIVIISAIYAKFMIL